jgi:phenylacetate-coenzyme A ligase PaaK-like adenylate-forming protein
VNLFRKSAIRGALRTMLPAYSVIRSNPVSYPLLFLPDESFEQARWRVSEWRVWWISQQARRTTPAYRAFLAERQVGDIAFDGMRPRIEELPEMDKPSYVNRWPIEARCAGGRFPQQGLLIHESSGSSGTPTNWVRSSADRADAEYGFDYALRAHRKIDSRPVIAINAFALGPWATGIYIAGALSKLAICKNTGPDVAKIENTLRFFGDRYRFILLGYPPVPQALRRHRRDRSGPFVGDDMRIKRSYIRR